LGINLQRKKYRYHLENLPVAGNLGLQSNVGACVFVNALSFLQISLGLVSRKKPFDFLSDPSASAVQSPSPSTEIALARFTTRKPEDPRTF
jgi:hypothetical protein